MGRRVSRSLFRVRHKSERSEQSEPMKAAYGDSNAVLGHRGNVQMFSDRTSSKDERKRTVSIMVSISGK